MNTFVKPALALGLAGALALAVATPSEARSGRNAAAIGAGVAGFAVGAAVGAAAANNNRYYYGEPYGSYGYAPAPAYVDSYAYSPAPTYYADPGVTYYNSSDPSSYYRAGGSYGPHSYTGWQNRERQLRGGDW